MWKPLTNQLNNEAKGPGAVEISDDGSAQTVWLSRHLLPQNSKNVANWLEMAKSSITPQSMARMAGNGPLVRSHSQRRRARPGRG